MSEEDIQTLKSSHYVSVRLHIKAIHAHVTASDCQHRLHTAHSVAILDEHEFFFGPDNSCPTNNKVLCLAVFKGI